MVSLKSKIKPLKKKPVPEEESTTIVGNVDNRSSDTTPYRKTLELSTLCLLNFLVSLYSGVIIGHTEREKQNVRM
jgi:hypothetical protein